jgi:hypothetical protein
MIYVDRDDDGNGTKKNSRKNLFIGIRMLLLLMVKYYKT